MEINKVAPAKTLATSLMQVSEKRNQTWPLSHQLP